MTTGGAYFWIDHSFQAEFDAGRIKVFTVVKLHSLSQVEFPGCFIDDFVGRRQKGLDLDLIIPLKQGIKDIEANVVGRSFEMVVRVQGSGINPLGNDNRVFIRP